jgi:hypothetical protein
MVQKKAPRREPLFEKIKKQKRTLVHSLLGHLGALRRTLTGLETRIGLVDDVEGALTLDDLTISVAAFGGGEGRKNFHRTSG